MKIVSCCSFKGGTGKTTVSMNVGCNLAQLSKRNLRVLLVDLDPQANLTSSLGIDSKHAHIFNDQFSIQDLIQKTKIKNLDIVPSSVFFEKYRYIDNPCNQSLNLLQTSLRIVKNSYDVCIIDTPPSVGMISREVFLASHHIIVCLIPDPFSILGLQKIKEMSVEIEKKQKDWVLGIVFSFWDNRNATNRMYMDIVQSIYPDKIFNNKIRKDVNISRSLIQETSVFNAYPRTRSTNDFINLADEIENKLFPILEKESCYEKAN